jgi:hypothetical protein
VLNFSKPAAPQTIDEREFSDEPSLSEAEEHEEEDTPQTPPSSEE